jgi:hypothetical protein
VANRSLLRARAAYRSRLRLQERELAFGRLCHAEKNSLQSECKEQLPARLFSLVFSIKQILKGGKVKRLDSQRPELRTSGRRILIVEDEVLISISAAQTLSDAGYHVVGVARTAVEPVEMAAAYRPDLVIMDIRLHDGPDGLAAAH